MNILFFKRLFLVCFFISLFYLIKLLTLNLFYINKGAFGVHSPIFYINQRVDLAKTGLIQEFSFKNRVKGKYNIEAMIESPTSIIATRFNGNYKISILKDNNVVSQIRTSGDALVKDSFKSYLYSDIEGQYYVLGEVYLNEIGVYTLKIENINVLLSNNSIIFKLILSPIEYNTRIAKRDFFIKVVVCLIITITTFVLMKRI